MDNKISLQSTTKCLTLIIFMKPYCISFENVSEQTTDNKTTYQAIKQYSSHQHHAEWQTGDFLDLEGTDSFVCLFVFKVGWAVTPTNLTALTRKFISWDRSLPKNHCQLPSTDPGYITTIAAAEQPARLVLKATCQVWNTWFLCC